MSSKNFMAYGDAETILTGFANDINANTKGVAEQKVLLPATVGWTGKNLLPNTVESRTVNDLVVTHNNDGTVTVDGTASAETWITIYRDFNSSSVQYELSGCVGGSNSTYFQILVIRNSGDTADETYYQDFGTGVKFTPPQGRRCPVYIVVKNGQQLDNVVFSPMLRDSRITDPTYEPYHKSVEECKQDKTLSSAVSVGGVSQTTVEGAIGALAALPNGNKVVKIDIPGSSAVTGQYFSATLSAVPSISVGDILVLAIHCNHTFSGSTGAGWGLSLTVNSATTTWGSNLFRNYPIETSSSGSFTSVFKDSFVPTGKVYTFVCFEMIGTSPQFLMIAEENAQPGEQTVTLSTSATSTVTFTRDDITTASVVEVGVSEWGLVPEDVVCSAGSCTVTLPKVSSAHSVTVRLYVR